MCDTPFIHLVSQTHTHTRTETYMRGHICTVDEVWYFVYPKGGQQLRGHAEVDERLACIPPDRAEQVTRVCMCVCVCV
jgi:hypothetical protein